MANNPKRNSEGYSDLTAYNGLRPIIAEENALEKDVNMLIKILKYIISKSGFELINRIELKHNKTGRIFK